MLDGKSDPFFLNLFTEYFNILDQFESCEFDHDPMILFHRLKKIKKDVYDINDRYIIVMFDTDYYWHGHGINLNNIFEIWRALDIPFFTMIIYTNNFGLTREVDDLMVNHHDKDRPLVVETFINPMNYHQATCDVFEPNINKITHHALCLMRGQERPYRYAAYTAFKDIEQDRLVMTVKGKQSCD